MEAPCLAEPPRQHKFLPWASSTHHGFCAQCMYGERYCNSWKRQFHILSVMHEPHELDAFLFPRTPSHMWSVRALCRYTYALALVASSSAKAAPLAQRSGSGPVSPTAGKRRASKRSTTLPLIALPSCLRHWASDTTCLKWSGFMPTLSSQTLAHITLTARMPSEVADHCSSACLIQSASTHSLSA